MYPPKSESEAKAHHCATNQDLLPSSHSRRRANFRSFAILRPLKPVHPSRTGKLKRGTSVTQLRFFIICSLLFGFVTSPHPIQAQLAAKPDPLARQSAAGAAAC